MLARKRPIPLGAYVPVPMRACPCVPPPSDYSEPASSILVRLQPSNGSRITSIGVGRHGKAAYSIGGAGSESIARVVSVSPNPTNLQSKTSSATPPTSSSATSPPRPKIPPNREVTWSTPSKHLCDGHCREAQRHRRPRATVCRCGHRLALHIGQDLLPRVVAWKGTVIHGYHDP